MHVENIQTLKPKSMSKFHNPEITIYDNARTQMNMISKSLNSLVDVLNDNKLGVLLEPLEMLKESELLAKHNEWTKEFNLVQNLLYSLSALMYKQYSLSVNALKHIIDDFDMVILVNNEPFKNVRVYDNMLYSSMILYDPDIKRYINNTENSWKYIKNHFPKLIKNLITLLDTIGIDIFDPNKCQLKPPKILKKANDFKGSGNGIFEFNYFSAIEATSNIESCGVWDNIDRGQELLTVIQFLETQSEIDTVIPYDITEKGLI